MCLGFTDWLLYLLINGLLLFKRHLAYAYIDYVHLNQGEVREVKGIREVKGRSEVREVKGKKK